VAKKYDVIFVNMTS